MKIFNRNILIPLCFLMAFLVVFFLGVHTLSCLLIGLSWSYLDKREETDLPAPRGTSFLNIIKVIKKSRPRIKWLEEADEKRFYRVSTPFLFFTIVQIVLGIPMDLVFIFIGSLLAESYIHVQKSSKVTIF